MASSLLDPDQGASLSRKCNWWWERMTFEIDWCTLLRNEALPRLIDAYVKWCRSAPVIYRNAQSLICISIHPNFKLRPFCTYFCQWEAVSMALKWSWFTAPNLYQIPALSTALQLTPNPGSVTIRKHEFWVIAHSYENTWAWKTHYVQWKAVSLASMWSRFTAVSQDQIQDEAPEPGPNPEWSRLLSWDQIQAQQPLENMIFVSYFHRVIG